jgi:hypothetical protein
LRYLEHSEFRLVRESLKEREVLWAAAPHIVHPLRFVLPVRAGMRPAWMLRAGLFLYDHIGERRRLAPARTLRRGRAGALLRGAVHLAVLLRPRRELTRNQPTLAHALALARLGKPVHGHPQHRVALLRLASPQRRHRQHRQHRLGRAHR